MIGARLFRANAPATFGIACPAACTPSYNNAEGERSMAAARNVAHPGNLMNYVAHP